MLSQMISDHRRAQIMGNKEEKRTLARQLGNEGQKLIQVKQSRLAEEKKRDMAEIARCNDYSAAWNAQRDQQADMQRQRAFAAAEENRRLAENKRRNEFAAKVRTDMKEEFDIAKSKHKIQSGIIR